MIRKLEKCDYEKIVFLGKLLKENFDISSIGEKEEVYVYEEENEIFGFIQVLSLYETLEIINIAVDTDKRNFGIGTKLVEYVNSAFNPEHILLEVRSKNEVARKFYQKIGFLDIRTIKNYYDDDDAIVMERK